MRCLRRKKSTSCRSLTRRLGITWCRPSKKLWRSERNKSSKRLWNLNRVQWSEGRNGTAKRLSSRSWERSQKIGLSRWLDEASTAFAAFTETVALKSVFASLTDAITPTVLSLVLSCEPALERRPSHWRSSAFNRRSSAIWPFSVRIVIPVCFEQFSQIGGSSSSVD